MLGRPRRAWDRRTAKDRREASTSEAAENQRRRSRGEGGRMASENELVSTSDRREWSSEVRRESARIFANAWMV